MTEDSVNIADTATVLTAPESPDLAAVLDQEFSELQSARNEWNRHLPELRSILQNSRTFENKMALERHKWPGKIPILTAMAANRRRWQSEVMPGLIEELNAKETARRAALPNFASVLSETRETLRKEVEEFCVARGWGAGEFQMPARWHGDARHPNVWLSVWEQMEACNGELARLSHQAHLWEAEGRLPPPPSDRTVTPI